MALECWCEFVEGVVVFEVMILILVNVLMIFAVMNY